MIEEEAIVGGEETMIESTEQNDVRTDTRVEHRHARKEISSGK